jgi:RNA 2',3'-cyclic 3'-phosphodiesterase
MECSTDTIRTFVAVGLPTPVRVHLRELVGAMSGPWSPRSVRWLAPGTWHLTLRFLGDTRRDAVRRLSAGLDAVAAGRQAFNLSLAATGCFPNPRRPRVIWVGVTDPDGRLAVLQQAVEEMVRAHGWEPEARAFRPHLTLGRVREGAQPPGDAWLAAADPLGVPVERIHLVESRLKSTGAEYQSLHSAVLESCGRGLRQA